MKVWIVHNQGDFADVLGVYDTEEKAKEAIKEGVLVEWCYTITELILNAKLKE